MDLISVGGELVEYSKDQWF